MKFPLTPKSHLIIHPFDSFEELAKELVPDLTSGSVALSGGSTYDTLFTEWAKLKVNLEGNWYCAVDERAVPMSDPESNWGNACKKLFTPTGVPEQCNNHYTTPRFFDRLLQNRFSVEPYHFDTIFLGVGDDGHTASLFPGRDDAENSSKSCFKTKSPKGVETRVTLGCKVIAEAGKVVTVIAGENKTDCIQWLNDRDMTKPFISVLSKCKESIVYIDSKLYSLLEA